MKYPGIPPPTRRPEPVVALPHKLPSLPSPSERDDISTDVKGPARCVARRHSTEPIPDDVYRHRPPVAPPAPPRAFLHHHDLSSHGRTLQAAIAECPQPTHQRILPRGHRVRQPRSLHPAVIAWGQPVRQSSHQGLSPRSRKFLPGILLAMRQGPLQPV